LAAFNWFARVGVDGGEPLLRPKFIHKIVDYSAKKDIFVYLPRTAV